MSDKDKSSTNQADEQMAERLQKYLHALPEIYKGFREDISALIATVKALRAEQQLAIDILSPNVPRTDLCDAARQIVFAHAMEKGSADKLQSQLAALREWKESAMKLLSRYDGIAETFGGKLGSSKLDNLERGVAALREENERLSASVTFWQAEALLNHFCSEHASKERQAGHYCTVCAKPFAISTPRGEHPPSYTTLREERDSWRRVSERLEAEKSQVEQELTEEGLLLAAEECSMKRGYSKEFKPHGDTGKRYLLDQIPAGLWTRVRAKAKQEGVSLRALILRLLTEWLEKEN